MIDASPDPSFVKMTLAAELEFIADQVCFIQDMLGPSPDSDPDNFPTLNIVLRQTAKGIVEQLKACAARERLLQKEGKQHDQPC